MKRSSRSGAAALALALALALTPAIAQDMLRGIDLTLPAY